MNSKTKLFVLICALSLVFASIGVHAANFLDTEGHWAEKVIDKWSGKGVIVGYEGYFRPDDNITRGDMALILNRVMDYSEIGENVFEDLDTSAYFAEAVLKLNKAGIMFGSEGYVRPRDFITREEAFVMLDRVYNFEGNATTTGFDDENEVSDWAKDSILAMCQYKIVNGRDGKIHPKANITRAEIIQLLENITGYLGGIADKGDDKVDEELDNEIKVDEKTDDKTDDKIDDDSDLEFGSDDDKKGNSSGMGIIFGDDNNKPSVDNDDNDDENETPADPGDSGNTGDGGNTGDDQEPDDNLPGIGGGDIEVGGIW